MTMRAFDFAYFVYLKIVRVKFDATVTVLAWAGHKTRLVWRLVHLITMAIQTPISCRGKLMMITFYIRKNSDA